MIIEPEIWKRIKFFIYGLASMGTLRAEHFEAHQEAYALAQLIDEVDAAPDEGPLTDGDSRRLPYISKKASVLQGSDHIAVARSKTMAKRIANALNKHTPNDEGI